MESFATPPSTTLILPLPLKIGIHPTAITELHTLLTLSRLTKATYENTTRYANYGVTREWLQEAVRFWKEDFDW
jgi:microsomal epoxide hydrolase